MSITILFIYKTLKYKKKLGAKIKIFSNDSKRSFKNAFHLQTNIKMIHTKTFFGFA